MAGSTVLDPAFGAALVAGPAFLGAAFLAAFFTGLVAVFLMTFLAGFAAAFLTGLTAFLGEPLENLKLF